MSHRTAKIRPPKRSGAKKQRATTYNFGVLDEFFAIITPFVSNRNPVLGHVEKNAFEGVKLFAFRVQRHSAKVLGVSGAFYGAKASIKSSGKTTTAELEEEKKKHRIA